MADNLNWWPEAYVDEVCPPSRPTPSAWIDGPLGDVWKIADPNALESDDAPGEPLTVQPNQIVNFVCSEDLGKIEVTINPDGTYEAHGEIPAEADHFWEPYDPDTLGFSMEEFAKNWAKMEDAQEPRRVTVGMAWWSDVIPHRLEITLEGARFVPLANGVPA